MKRVRCEWCGRSRNLERFGEDAWLCRDQSDCEKHWPDVWPAGTRGVPEDRTEGHVTVDASLTSCDELELRRRVADGDQDAGAELARRNRLRVGRAQADPKGHRAPDRRKPSVGYVSTGTKRTGSGGSVGGGGVQVA